jgi:hypothetical protein
MTVLSTVEAVAGWWWHHAEVVAAVTLALAVLAVGGTAIYRVADALATLRLKRRGADALDAYRLGRAVPWGAGSGYGYAPWGGAAWPPGGARGPDGRSQLYANYMARPQWRTRSQRTLLLAGGACQRCGRAPAREAHHLTYERLGHEADADLLAVCKPCHAALHGRS